ncbi:YhgE/Pip domain-containing protein [Aquibacillus kalidii]|uniref:YhgE/Pip domain-containing protein n=1 Tax=Aquibacillus kalidii TaxID=2762597 RepID=UPI0016479492|nr:YhgE/Pip domain-containing protein [Aquibacillus kalidii]
MNGFRLWLAEWKGIATNRKVLIPFFVLLFVPLIYGGMFLWANWDPYGTVEQLPVAIVNQDTGAKLDGENLEIGKDFVEELQKKGNFDYKLVTEEEAYAGLDNQTYYLVFKIPANFSEHASTLLDKEPKKLELTYISNEGMNYIAGKIGDSATEKMKSDLSNEISKTYADTMFKKFQDMQEGFTEANNKASELNKGAKELNKGAKELKTNLAQFASKQVQFSQSTNKMANGISELTTKTQELSSGLTKLDSGFNEIKSGASDSIDGITSIKNGIKEGGDGIKDFQANFSELMTKTEELQTGADSLSGKLSKLSQGTSATQSGAETLNEGMNQLQKSLEPVIASLSEEQQKQIRAQIAALANGSKKLSEQTLVLASSTEQLASKAKDLPTNIGKLAEGQTALYQATNEMYEGNQKLYAGTTELIKGQTKLKVGIETFASNLSDASSGAQKLADGTNQLHAKTDTLTSSSSQLADGSKNLSTGAVELSNGTVDLHDGTNEFKNTLSTASEEANQFQPNSKTEDMMASPVEVKEQEYHSVPNYGTGLTPYFLSLGLFVGALLLTIIYDINKPAALPSSGIGWFMAKFGVLAVAGILQALIVASFILFGLDLQVNSIGMFYVFAVATSLTFVAIIQMLVTTMGNPGRFLAILILIGQLTTSGGTFPVQLIPQPLQPIHSLLPMSYTLEGFREIISIGNYNVMWHDLSILSIFLVSSLLITLAYFIIKHKKNVRLENLEQLSI